VDDKIIEKAKIANVDARKFAQEQLSRIDKDLCDLGIKRATVEPRATEYIQEIIDFITVLIEKDYAYVAETGDVYFCVEKYADYGSLSNRNIDDSISGTRIGIAGGKKDEKDFALWKIDQGDMVWDSPWGVGRPGWHIECSTMCYHCLGDKIDIHGGGKDLIFPHHENELAQSNAYTGNDFVNYWMHCGLVLVSGQKMSKSLNNSIMVRDLLDNYEPEAIRYLLLQYSYQSEIDFVDGVFDKAEKSLYKLYKVLNEIDNAADGDIAADGMELPVDIKSDFQKAMNDDFNMSLATSNLFEYFKIMMDLAKKPSKASTVIAMRREIASIYSVLGLFQDSPKRFLSSVRNKYFHTVSITEDEIHKMIRERQAFKENKEYSEADRVRNELLNHGISLLDLKTQTEWEFSVLL
jgi:cysteinyl-tRNA synthetase